MASSSSSPFRQLPATPGASAAPSSPTSAGRPSSSSSNTTTPSSPSATRRESNRLSMQPRRTSNVPRPAPIPIPEPVTVEIQNDTGRPSHSSSSGEGAPSTDSGQELEHARAAMAVLANANANANGEEGSPSTSPLETSNLLLQQANGELTPRSSRSPPTPPTSGKPIPRPRSAVETGAAMHDSASRPHSSADAWSMQRPSSANMDANGQSQSPPGANSRSHSPSADSLLRPAGGHGPMPRSRSSGFISSPLNPSSAPVPRRPGSSSSRPPSMVLYRLVGIGDDVNNPQMSSLAPPVTTASRRASRFSTMSSSTSIISDSKYPLPVGEDGTFTPPPSGAFLPYEYDPSWDLDAPDDAEDVLHTPDPPGKKERIGAFGLRGVLNVCVVFTILSALIVLFAIYPIISYYDTQARTSLFSGGTNGGTTTTNTTTTTRTSQDFVDPDTPEDAKSWTGFDNTAYKLVFSDEFKTDGRTFNPGDDPFWQAVNLWDVKSNDLNWYSSDHVTTKNGYLQITLDATANNGYAYTSGMLQSWNQFCFTGGYIEISVSLPGTAQNVGYTPQAYTMGNLARSGYRATEDGLLPYSYNTCDNAVLLDQNGDGTLSTLSAQRLSACTCLVEETNGEHPGPVGTANPLTGRGAPQIDILGALSQTGNAAGTVTQSVRIAPMSTNEETAAGVTVVSPADAQQNPYIGGTTEQVVGSLTNVPTGSYVESGTGFTKFGYQLIPNTATPNSAAVRFSMNSEETVRVQGSAFPATGNTLGQRLISNEPMYVVLSLALSQLVQTPDPTQLTFPAKFLIDYVRVYQPANQAAAVSCDPSNYPTAAYINKHMAAYNDSTQLTWAGAGYTVPTNSLANNC